MNMPKVVNLRMDPPERAMQDSHMYFRWYADKLWTFQPAQAIVGQLLGRSKRFPPSLENRSFSLDQVLKQLQAPNTASN